MPIVGRNPTAPAPVKETVALDKSGYRSVAVDHRDLRLASLSAYLQGMPWKVEAYYSQKLGADNQIRELDIQLSPANQQYSEVKDAELRVQSSNQSSFDSEHKTTTVTGSAVLQYIIPNENDYFVAGAGLLRKGLYRVKTIERRSHEDHAVYLIDYELDSYVTEDSPKYVNLLAKVVDTKVFVRERVTEGMSPVVKTEAWTKLSEIALTVRRMERDYVQEFFSRETQLLMVPQVDRVYDARLNDFLAQINGLGEEQEFLDIRRVSFDRETYMSRDCILQAMIERDIGMLDIVEHKCTVVPKAGFWRNSWIRGPVFWPNDKYVYPAVSVEKALHAEDDPPAIGTSSLCLSKAFSVYQKPEDPADDVTNGEGPYLDTWNRFEIDGEVVPLVKPACEGEYYILSQAFYEQTDELSVLEILVRDYMTRRTIDLVQLKAITDSQRRWPSLERYYYTPLLFLIHREAMRGFYDD